MKGSTIHIHVSILPHLPSKLARATEQSSMCYTVGPCWLPILNIAVCTWSSQSPQLSLPPTPATMSSFSKSVSLFLLCKLSSFVSFLFRFHICSIPHDISPSLSSSLHSVWHALGPSMLLQMALFHSFLWLRSIPLKICTTWDGKFSVTYIFTTIEIWKQKKTKALYCSEVFLKYNSPLDFQRSP